MKINVFSGDTLLLSKKKRKVAPGEMESITIQAALLQKAKQLEFTLEAV